jgi:hypothetical protein
MKTLTLTTIIIFAAILSYSQNVQTYNIKRAHGADSLYYETKYIDYNLVFENGFINANAAEKMHLWYKSKNIINTLPATNRKGVYQILALIGNGWTSANIDKMSIGNYAGIDTTIAAIFELYFSTESELRVDRLNMMLHFRHLLYARTEQMIESLGDTMFVAQKRDNGIVGGKLFAYNFTLGWAILIKKGGEVVIVNIYTLCPANIDEQNKY